MGNAINHPSRLSEEQRSVIRRGVRKGLGWASVHKKVSELKPVTQKLVKEQMDHMSAELSVKSEAKTEGTKLVSEFISKTKDGSNVDDMAAALEQAVYRDILRRYVESEDPLVSMTMEQILKLDLSYRSSRLKRQDKSVSDKEGGLAARVLLEGFEKLISLCDSEVGEKLKPLRKDFVDWAKQKYGKEKIEKLERERSDIEKLASYIRSRGNSTADKRTVGNKAAIGIFG